MSLPAGLCSTLEAAFNGYLNLDSFAASRMAELQGRLIALELHGLELTIYIAPGEERVAIREHSDREPDTILRGTPLALARLGMSEGATRTLFSGVVEIEGDVEAGQKFRDILDGMDIDWEEQLARLTGDVAAHQLGNLARTAGKTLLHSRRTLENNLTEYLQEEARILPSRIEVENFITDVDRLSMDVDRLEARVKRLYTEAGKPS